MRRRRCVRKYRTSKFGVVIRDDEDVLVLLRHFRKRSKDILCDKFEGPGCWKKLKFAFMRLRRIVPCATLAFADYALNICSHV